LTVGPVAKENPQRFLLSFFAHLEIADEPFLFQDAGDFHLEPRRGHFDALMARSNPIPDSSKHVRDGISNG
jgi:hypothetical protein